MQDNKIHATPWTPNPERDTELFCVDKLDPGVGYLCFNQMYPQHDYRVIRVNKDVTLGQIILFFDKIRDDKLDPSFEVLLEANRYLLDTDNLIIVINLTNNSFNTMDLATFKLNYQLLPTTYEKFYPRSYSGKKVKVFDRSSLETLEIVVLSRDVDLANIVAKTIEDAPTHFKLTARVLSHEDMYRQFAQGKTIGVSYDKQLGIITYYREDIMSRFYVIKGEKNNVK